MNQNLINYRKTKKGVLTNIYSKQKERSKLKGYPAPSYSLAELHDLYLNDLKFNRLYNEWVKSNYNKSYKPSIDRINCKIPYTIKNIQILSWSDNRFKQSMERRKRGKSIIMKKDGIFVERFNSVRDAVKKTGFNQSGISSCLSKKYKFTFGFQFEYEVIGNIHANPDLL